MLFCKDVCNIRVARDVPDMDDAGLLGIADGNLANVEVP
jgi:hypothetical protein